MTPYGTSDGFTAYMTAMGYTVPSGDQAQARLRGSVSLDATYAERWIGTQAAFPQDRVQPVLQPVFQLYAVSPLLPYPAGGA